MILYARHLDEWTSKCTIRCILEGKSTSRFRIFIRTENQFTVLVSPFGISNSTLTVESAASILSGHSLDSKITIFCSFCALSATNFRKVISLLSPLNSWKTRVSTRVNTFNWSSTLPERQI
uniref:Uncharacterized protein n=1 Tax=Arundo donax TaxID=35708 RepID=A0A0A9CX83_ARUDO